MNCFNLNPIRAKSLSRGIPLTGLDGVDLGSTLVPFNKECLSDLSQHMSKMTYDGLLIDADLAGGTIIPRDPSSSQMLVRLVLELGLGPEVRLSTDTGGVSIRAHQQAEKIEHVVGQPYYQDSGSYGWRTFVAVLVSLPPNVRVDLEWTTPQYETRWFRSKRVLVDHRASLLVKDGMPVFSQQS